ncbi:hypothetical protein DJ81_13130 [Halorubrum sp. Hd13]|nr:hypothetical protein DJ81_13130 [Halorubrum sp. Hd13]
MVHTYMVLDKLQDVRMRRWSMGRATDPRHRYESEKERVSKLPDGDADAITEFLRALDPEDLGYQHTKNGNIDTKAASTLVSYGRALRLLTDELDDDLLDVSTGTFNEQFATWKDDGFADKTIKQRQSALIKFLRYHGDAARADPDGIVFVKVENPNGTIEPEDVLTGDDVEAMRSACSNWRDQCLIDMLAYTGQRVRAIQTLRLKDVDPKEGESGRYRLNTDDLGLKGADKIGEKRPLLGAQKAVREWTRSHPTGDPDDYLITGLPGSNRPNGVSAGDYLGRTSLMTRLKVLADRADVEKDVNPHAFRHFFVTTCKRDYDMDDSKLKFLIGHNQDSRVMETTYQHLSDQEFNLAVEESHGYEVEKDDSALTPATCITCDEPLPGSAKACPGCGTVYTPDAQDAKSQITEGIEESYKQADPQGGETMEEIEVVESALDENMDAIMQSDELMDKIADRVAERINENS